MRLDQDQFVVTLDRSKASDEALLEAVKKAGYSAKIVADRAARHASGGQTVPRDHPLLAKAIAQAREEHKPILVDFYAEWCVPCRKMEKVTFADPKVAPLLERCVLLKVDTDRHPELAKQAGVSGLPDLRLLAPDGTEKKRLLGFQSADTMADALRQLLALVTK